MEWEYWGEKWKEEGLFENERPNIPRKERIRPDDKVRGGLNRREESKNEE